MMDLSNYRKFSRVRIELTNGFYFLGSVIESSQDSITIKDKNGDMISLSSNSILYIREVS